MEYRLKPLRNCASVVYIYRYFFLFWCMCVLFVLYYCMCVFSFCFGVCLLYVFFVFMVYVFIVVCVTWLFSTLIYKIFVLTILLHVSVVIFVSIVVCFCFGVFVHLLIHPGTFRLLLKLLVTAQQHDLFNVQSFSLILHYRLYFYFSVVYFEQSIRVI